MRNVKVLMGNLAGLTVALMVGCGGSSQAPLQPDSYPLDAGSYAFTFQSVISNSCWAATSNWPPLITTQVEVVETSGTSSLTIVPPHPAQWLAPPLSGDKSGDQISTKGSRVVVYSSNCSLQTADSMDAAMYAPDAFDGELQISYSAAVMSSSGAMSDCSALAGKTINLVVPFPNLSNPVNGSCQVSLAVHAEPQT